MCGFSNLFVDAYFCFYFCFYFLYCDGIGMKGTTCLCNVITSTYAANAGSHLDLDPTFQAGLNSLYADPTHCLTEAARSAGSNNANEFPQNSKLPYQVSTSRTDRLAASHLECTNNCRGDFDCSTNLKCSGKAISGYANPLNVMNNVGQCIQSIQSIPSKGITNKDIFVLLKPAETKGGIPQPNYMTCLQENAYDKDFKHVGQLVQV